MVYGGAVWARRFLYDRDLLAVHAPPCRTISVGGLEVGGSGKTPVTGEVLRRLLAMGKRPGLLTRGYGRRSRGLVVRRRGEAPSPAAIGDEPAMLVGQGLDVPVAACGRRVVGAAALAAECDVLVLDDAFSHRALARHLDIVVVRGELPLGAAGGHLLPWGTLREPPSSLRRAHVVWLHYRRDEPPSAPPPWMRARAPQALCIMSVAMPDAPHNRRGETVPLHGATVVGAAGVAHPDDFQHALTHAGAHVAAFHAFADHHEFTARDVSTLRASQVNNRAAAVVVTPKDAVKLLPLWPDENLWILGTCVRLTFGEEALRKSLEKSDSQ